MEVCSHYNSIFTTVFLTLLFLNFPNTVQLPTVESTKYTKLHGYQLQSPCISGENSARSLLHCAARCSTTPTCVSGSYAVVSGLCCVSDKRINTAGATYVQDAESRYFQTKQETDWTLVFKATAEIGQLVYGEYLDTSHHHDDVDSSCWSLYKTPTCPMHLRSSLLNSWADGSLQVKKVKFSFYTNGAEVINIVFNGTGSDLTSWFQRSKVISSTYTDLTPTQAYNDFDAVGFNNGKTLRRFYVSSSHGGCQGDIGWVAVVEDADCAWDNLGTPYPYFVYSPYTTYTNWHTAAESAEVLAIFVEL